jgi:hypothetical protein
MMAHTLPTARDTRTLHPSISDPFAQGGPADVSPARKRRVFLSAPAGGTWPIPGLRRDPGRSRFLIDLAAESLGIPHGQILTALHIWVMKRGPMHDRNYPDGLAETMESVTGVVLVIPGNGFPIGAGVMAELAAAESAGRPVIAVTADGDVSPLDHCTVEPLADPDPPTRVARFVMPDGGSRLSDVRRVLEAMGFNALNSGAA